MATVDDPDMTDNVEDIALPVGGLLAAERV